MSNMGYNPTPYRIAISEENSCFLTPQFEFVKRDKNKDNQMLKTKEGTLDPIDSLISNCGIHSFKKLRIFKNHSN